MKSKIVSRGHLVRQLDTVFSQYIRLKDSVDGYATCVTCGTTKLWKEQQNGHFFSRSHYSTRWDENNCRVQDYRCNVALGGNYINYTKYMIDSHGREFVDELEKKSQTLVKISTIEIKNMIEKYKLLVKKLEITNG